MTREDHLFHLLLEQAHFSPEAMTKLDCFRSPRLFVGLNCFEIGQGQRVHTHADQDKVYLVVSGKATMIVGAIRREVGPGTLVLAPARMPHGVERAHERTVLLVAMAPAPGVKA